MILQLPAFVVKPVLLASSHGLHDCRHSPHELAFYTLVLLPIPHVTPLFLAASVRHFSHDVGKVASLAIHVLWMSLFYLSRQEVAWSLFALYYVCIHSFSRMCEWFKESPRQVCLALGLGIISSLLVSGDFAVNEAMQKGIIAHVLLDETSPKG